MIYRAKYVLPMDGRVIDDGEVLVQDGEIRGVGEGLINAHPSEELCELPDCALLPGFVNAHSHIDFTTSRNAHNGLNLWDWLDRVSYNKLRKPVYDQVLDSAVTGASELARSGVTCLGDCSPTGAAAEAMTQVGLRGIVYREIFGQSMGADYRAKFEQAIEEARDLQSRQSPLVQIGISPHAIYSSNREVLELTAATYAELNIPVAVHAAETEAERDYSLSGTGPIAEWRRTLGYEPMVTGLTPVRYLEDVGLLRKGVYLAHCVHVSDEEIDLIARSGTGVAHCARSNAYLGCGVAPVPKLIRSGVCMGLGTDGPASCLTLDFFDEMRFALAIHRALAKDAGVITAK
ncbi:MAG: hypothetical protein A2Z18_10250, partial [Armatimonadetes bacterium RBG_16_58_9]